METKCDLIKDLIPLYTDNLCSEYSKSLVKEHIDNCPSCKRILDTLLQQDSKNLSEAEYRKEINPLKKIAQKNFKIKLISIVSIMIVVFISAYVALTGLYVADTSKVNVVDITIKEKTSFVGELILQENFQSISNVEMYEDKGIVSLRVWKKFDLFSNSEKSTINLDYKFEDDIKEINLVGDKFDDVKSIWK